MAMVDKFGAKEVLDVIFYDAKTGKPKFFADTLKTSTISITAEQVSARGGKGNPKLITWDFNKEATMEITDALLSPRSFELLSGNAVQVGAVDMYMRQQYVWEDLGKGYEEPNSLKPLTADASGKVVLAKTPSVPASEILVYEDTDDGGTPLAEGVLSSLELTNVAYANKKLVIYYKYKSGTNSETYLITGDKFAGTYKIVGTTYVRDVEGQDSLFQIQINNYKVNSALDLAFQAEGDPSTFSLSGEIQRGKGTQEMIRMVKDIT